ncbi:hypothetical protein AT959_18180 [Dechloromonas denitrificans]|uniref:Uncharacterized protein n=1 Tax=Dechloromonas denitrificans TaxID=281362 RepID=A0A133XG12_9RHOO|nr:hypothetical protein [Dechloromonas denitrificans]KXB29846.1 hypothetical protein AT959_18180 [Dechloromonas denitrificans]
MSNNDAVSLRTGGLAAGVVIVGALALSAALAPDFLIGWATLGLVAMVPTQIVISLVWQSAYPKFIANLPQPWRGLGFMLLNGLLGGAIGYVAWAVVGGGSAPPTPFVNMYLIFAVPVMLFLVIPLQAWPCSRFCRSPGSLGAALIVSAYGLAYLLFRLLFNFDFMADAPFYAVDLDPQGLFMAWQPLVLSIAAVVPMLALVLFDFWPISVLAGRYPALARQPLSGLLASVLVAGVTLALWGYCVELLAMDIVLFMVRVCVTLNFGFFIILVMFEGMPSLRLPQPWRGLLLCLLGGGLAMLMLFIYQLVAVGRFALPSGGPGYPLELWLASAMLAVSFPAMVAFAGYFQFWPMARRAAPAAKDDTGNDKRVS